MPLGGSPVGVPQALSYHKEHEYISFRSGDLNGF